MTRSKWLVAVGGNNFDITGWPGAGSGLGFGLAVLINIRHNTDDQGVEKKADGLLTKSKKTRRTVVDHLGDIGPLGAGQCWTREGDEKHASWFLTRDAFSC